MAFGGFRFAGLELKNIAGSGGMKALLIALLVIPCLCAAFYLGSLADPYKSLEAVPVAIVNEDEGATINGEKRNVGEEVCDDVAARTDGLKWSFVSADEAQAGMESGAYYMVCTIPSDFSEKIASADTGEPKAADLGIEYNESKNAAASQMGRSVWQSIQAQVTNSVTRQYWNTMLTRSSDAGESMEESSAGAEQLAQGMETVVEGNSAITEGISGMGQGAAALQSGLSTLVSGGDAIAQGATALGSTGSVLDAGAQGMATGLSALASQTSALGEQTGQLASGAQAVDEGLKATVDSIGSSDQAFDMENPTLAASSQTVTSLSQATGAGLESLDGSLASIEGNAAAALDEGLSSAKRALDGVAADLRAVADQAAAAEDDQAVASQVAKATNAANAAAGDVTDAQGAVGAAQQYEGGAQTDIAEARAALDTLVQGGTLSAEDAATVSAAIGLLDGASGNLDYASASLATAADSLTSASAYASDASTAANAISGMTSSGIATQIDAAAQAVESVSSNTIGTSFDAPLLDANSSSTKTLYAAANGIDAGLQGARAIGSGISQSNDLVSTASSGVTQGIDALGQGLSLTQQGTSALSMGTSALAAATPVLAEGIDQLDQGAQGLATGVSAYVSGASVLAQSLPAFTQGISTVASSTGALVSGADALAQASGQMGEGMTMVAESNQSLADQLSEDSEGLRMPKAEIEDKADMMSEPVELSESYYTHVNSFAAGLAPYFLAIGLWIGCLAASFALRPFDRRLSASGANPVATAFAGFVPFALIAVAQAVIMMLVLQFVLGMQVENVPQFYAFGLLVALVFAAIAQLLSAAFGLGGRLASIVLLMLQAACVAGVFPAETMGGLFQALGSILPMTYAVEGMRQIMTGIGFNVAMSSAGVLAVFLVACFALTALAIWRKRMVRMADLHPAFRAV